jgi:glutamine amidotransferase
MIVIVDYGMGNLNSVLKSVKNFTEDVTISSDLSTIESSEKLILPGVGHFKNGVENLHKNGIWEALNHNVIDKKKPILGICLGMQLMLSQSEEGDSKGLNWINGEVVRFKYSNVRLKIPHMGWNTLFDIKDNQLLNGITLKDEFYFVHSYYASDVKEENTLCRTNYIDNFASGVIRENIIGFTVPS